MGSPDRASLPRSPSQAIAQARPTLYVHEVGRGGISEATGTRWRLHARLLGGSADGRAVELDSLIPEIAVYLADGETIACDRVLPHAGEGRFIGIYRLASGAGPEPPIYVAGV